MVPEFRAHLVGRNKWNKRNGSGTKAERMQKRNRNPRNSSEFLGTLLDIVEDAWNKWDDVWKLRIWLFGV